MSDELIKVGEDRREFLEVPEGSHVFIWQCEKCGQMTSTNPDGAAIGGGRAWCYGIPKDGWVGHNPPGMWVPIRIAAFVVKEKT